MKFGYTIIYVPNVPQTLKFYEEAFGFKTRFLHDSEDYGELDTGATTLAFASEEMITLNGLTLRTNRPSETAAIEIGFVTDTPEAAYDIALAAGATSAKAPQVKPWGQTVAYVHDLNGCLVEICSPVGG